MIKRIVGFGDSWIHGDGLIDNRDNTKNSWMYKEQHCLIGQLAYCLQIPYDSATVKNFGTSGGSLQSTQWDFAQWVQNATDFSDTLVVVGLTESSRQSWWQAGEVNYIHNHHVFPGHGWDDFVKHYQTHSNDESLWQMNYWLATEFFNNWAVANNTRLAMFNIFPAPLQSPHVIKPDWNMRGELARMEHTVGAVTAPCKHPNKKGYKLLANHLHKLLQSSKII